MTAGTSLPSDFTPIPQVMLPYMQQAFVARSLAAGAVVGGVGSGAAFEQVGDMGVAAGGQYVEGPIFKRTLSGNRRDITSVSALTADKVEGANNKGVVLSRRTNLVAFSEATNLAGLSNEAISAVLATELGEVVFDTLLTTLIKACIGAIEAVSTTHVKTVWNASTRTNLSPTVLDSGRAILGDRRSVVTNLIARSESMLDMRTDAIGRSFDSVGGVALRGGEGTNLLGINRVMERDEAGLTVADAGYDKYISLLLSSGFLQFGFARSPVVEFDRDITLENKRTLWRADWDIVIRIPSMAYDSADGGANPTDTALATSTNWIDNTTSHKEVGGIEIVHNYSGN